MITPLPSVENATAMLQQEEAQRDLVLGHKNEDLDVTAMYSKGPHAKVYQCSLCGGKCHTNDRCWSAIGYPRWHPNYKGNQPSQVSSQYRPSAPVNTGPRPRWKSNYRPQGTRSANVAHVSECTQDTPLFSPQQLEQLAQFM